MTNELIIPTIPSTIELINAYALSIAKNDASDSTHDDMQFDIDCILNRDDIPDDMLEYADYAALDPALFDDLYAMIPDIDLLRAYALAAFNLRP